MVVAYNLQAIRTQGSYGLSSTGKKQSVADFSKSSPLNPSEEDAVGISISEKMYRQVHGLDHASANTQEAVSMVQAAGGALEEVYNKLQRMNDLCTEAAGDMSARMNRSAIQAEIDQINREIDRIASSTKFNDTNLLSGSATNSNSEFRAKIYRAQELMRLENKLDQYYRSLTATNTEDAAASVSPTSIRGLSGKGMLCLIDSMGASTSSNAEPALSMDAVDSNSLGTADVDVMTKAAATESIKKVHLALERVSAQHSRLDSYQSYLEQTIQPQNPLDAENTDMASQKENQDTAEEMMNVSFDNILGLAGQAMMAQANQLPQSVLSLLQ